MATENFTPVSEPTKDRLWEEMFDISRYVQYYDMQNSRLSAWDKIVKLNVLIGTAVAVASGFQAIHPLAGVGGALFMVVWTAIDYVLAFGSRAALSHAISLECSVIEKEYEELWMLVSAGSIGEVESQAKIKQLSMRVLLATAQLSGTARGINRKASKAAYKVMEAKWGQASHNATRATTTA